MMTDTMRNYEWEMDETMETLLTEEYYKEAEDMFEDKSKMEQLFKWARKLCDRLSSIPCIGKFSNDIQLIIDMVQDYCEGNYREIPMGSILMTLASLVYFVTPLDAIPDTVLVVGWLDDAAVLKMLFGTLKNDVKRYSEWKGRL